MTDFPRVTFLLIAYAQEKFAYDAAQGALSQDYPNLQIILSDDCSSDATFAELERAAKGSGRDVTVRRPPANLGLIAHIWDAAALAEGELIVLAAGDDISRPTRVSRLVAEWRQLGADGLTSDWDVVDDRGKLIRRGRPAGGTDLCLGAYFPGWKGVQLIGATAAYSRDVFATFAKPSQPVFAEDLYLTLMLAAFGRRTAYVDAPLIEYRQHDSALTHVPSRARSDRAFELARAAESAKIAELLATFRRDAQALETASGRVARVDWEAVEVDRAFNAFRARWIEASQSERVAAIARFATPPHRRWLLPRVLGLPALLILKRMFKR